MAEEETAQAEQESTTETFTKEQVQELLAKEIEGLKANRDEILGELKTFKAKAREEEAARVKLAEETARKNGDFEALEKSWAEKFTAREQELSDLLSQRESVIADLTVGATAARLASELAIKGSEKVLERIVRDRLGFEVAEGQHKVFVKDEAGQRSASTIDDLRKEILSDSALKPILQGTQATGAGGVGQNGGAAQKTVTRSQWDAMSHADRAAFSKNGGKVTDAA